MKRLLTEKQLRKIFAVICAISLVEEDDKDLLEKLPLHALFIALLALRDGLDAESEQYVDELCQEFIGDESFKEEMEEAANSVLQNLYDSLLAEKTKDERAVLKRSNHE